MAGKRATEHSLLGTFVLPVVQALTRHGLDPLPVLEAEGIDLARGANPDWRVSHERCSALLDRCVALTGDEAFGLQAAEFMQPQMLHGLGLAWLSSDTVLDGLKRLERFGRLVSSGLELALEEDGKLVHLRLGFAPDVAGLAPAGVDYAVGIVARMCRLTMGDFIAPVTVLMARPRPAQAERWEYLLATRVTFDGDLTRISWSLPDIREPLLTGDPALARVNDEHVRAHLDQFSADSTSRAVVSRIVEHLPDGPPSQELIARAMHVSNRTLQRKLREEGTSFIDLLRDTRMQLASKYLRQPNRSVVETAYLLGFSEPSTFSRAFKRWSGRAPAEFRAQAARLYH